MKKFLLLGLIFSFAFAKSQAPLADELVKMHSVTTTEMNAIVSPIEGSIIFNTNDASLYQFNGTNWIKLVQDESKTVILNRDGGSLPTQTNTFFDLPVDNANVQTINTSYFSVTGTAEITVLTAGNYLISGELSTTNMPSGDTKFILGVFINGVRRGYLSRGSVSLPGRDFWGTTGTLMYALNANDIVNIQYVINANGTTLNANFSNIGITKI